MNNNRGTRWTIYRRLLLLGTLPAMAMFVLLLLFFTQARLDDLQNHLFNDSQRMADNLAPALEFAVVTGHRELIDSLLKQALSNSRASYITVSDISGEAVASARHQSKASANDETGLHRFRRDIVQLPVALSQDEWSWSDGNLSQSRRETVVGSVEVAVSEDVLATEQRDILWSSLGIGLILFIGTVIFVGRLASRISQPIEQLIGNVESLTAGDYRISSQPTLVAQELETLQQAIVTMARQLQLTRKEREQTLKQVQDARDKAENASGAKTEFLTMMSHELRTPLNGIIGMLDMLAEEQLNSVQRDYLATARGATEDLLTLMTDILDFARIEQGRLAIDHRDFAVRPLLENCFSSFCHEAKSRGLDYQLRLRGDWARQPRASGDPGRLRQVLALLIGNAIKFTQEGHVLVTLHWSSQAEGAAVLSGEVEDSGSGISTDRFGDIFNSFQQLDSSNSRQCGGTGLGLPLVQRLVELMGGHVSVDSALACGSTFRFVVPLEVTQDDAEPVQPASTQNLLATRSVSYALVVEDNRINQKVAISLLENLGFNVDCADNGVQALEILQESPHPYAVVLMDCQMPVMDGWEATRQIRQREQALNLPAVPILAMTADVLSGTEDACRQAGMDDYLPKPVRRGNLREMLQRHLSL